MRSMPRAVPLLVLGLAVLLGSAVGALSARYPNGPKVLGAALPDRRVLAGVGVLLLLVFVNYPPLFTGQLIAKYLQHPQDIPSYWTQDIKALDRQDNSTRVLEIPGSDFASYRWGTTVDPITPGLMSRDYVARELVPYGTPPSADFLDAFDTTLQDGTLQSSALAPIARFMAAGDINVRSDLTYERYLLPRPKLLWDLVTRAEGTGASQGLGKPIGFGGTGSNVPDPRFPLLDETELGSNPNLQEPAEGRDRAGARPRAHRPRRAHQQPGGARGRRLRHRLRLRGAAAHGPRAALLRRHLRQRHRGAPEAARQRRRARCSPTPTASGPSAGAPCTTPPGTPSGPARSPSSPTRATSASTSSRPPPTRRAPCRSSGAGSWPRPPTTATR